MGFAAVLTSATKGKEIGREAATTDTGNGTSQPLHLLVAFQASPGLQQTLLASIQHPTDAPAEESSKEIPLGTPLLLFILPRQMAF